MSTAIDALSSISLSVIVAEGWNYLVLVVVVRRDVVVVVAAAAAAAAAVGCHVVGCHVVGCHVVGYHVDVVVVVDHYAAVDVADCRVVGVVAGDVVVVVVPHQGFVDVCLNTQIVA